MVGDAGGRVWSVCVDQIACEANALCVRTSPAVFSLDDESEELTITQPQPTLESRILVEQAVARCPKQALSIVEA